MNRLYALVFVLVLSFGVFAQTPPLAPPPYTVATLPAPGGVWKGKVVTVTDGLTKGDCTIGGGTWRGPCESNGTAWGNWGGDGTGAGGTPVAGVTGTSPINSSGGPNPVISIETATTTGVKGAASFNAADFNATGGNIDIDYTNGQAADASHKGFLNSTDWGTFNGKQNALGFTPLNPANNLSDVSSPSTSRTNLGATTVGVGFFTFTNPSAIRFPRIEADNSVTGRTAAQVLSDIGAQASLGFTPLDAALANSKIYIGNGSGIGTAVTPSGDVTITNAGVTAIGASKVLNSMLAGSIAYSKLSLTGAILNSDLAGSIAASKLVGSDINTVGTIGSGVWQGTKIGLAYGGTNADLSVTGGTSKFLKQASAGAAVTVAQPTFADLAAGNISASLIPATTDTYDLGDSSHLWRKGWLSELDTVLFAQNTISAVGGWMVIAKNEGPIPVGQDVGTGDTTIDFGQAMTTNDFVVMRTSGAVEYFQVGSVSSGTRYNVTRNLDGSGANAWPAGSVYVVNGNTTSGRIELNANSTPRISMIVQGATYNAQTEMARIGDLNGNWGIGSETYGFASGQYGTAGKAWFSVDPTNGVRLGSNATTRINLAADGSGFVANSLIAWDTSGNLTVSGNATIGGFSIGSDYLRDAANSFGMASTVTGGDDVRFWAGDTFANRATAPFRVTEAGVVTATAGLIGGWTVNSTGIQNSGGTVKLRGAGNLAFGSTPPTAANSGTGLFLDSTGLYGLASSVVQASFNAATGAINAGGTYSGIAKVLLDVNGLTINTRGAGTTSTDGILMVNDTGGAIQYSPRLNLVGNGYRSATSADTPVEFIQEVVPTGNSNASGSTWSLKSRINNTGSYVTGLTSDLAGNLAAVGTITASDSGEAALVSAGGIRERGRSVSMGVRSDVAYASGNFTKDAGTWTVDSGDQISLSYSIVGKTMTVVYNIYQSSVGGTASAFLQIAVPGGFTAAARADAIMRYNDNGTFDVGAAIVLSGGAQILLVKKDASNWAGSTNNTQVSGVIVIWL